MRPMRRARTAPRKPPAAERRRAAAILDGLEREYPLAGIQLDHVDPVQLMAAVILSAQCTDARVNLVTPGLFARYPDLQAFADADPAALEDEIRSCGLGRSKARSIIGSSRALLERFGGELPRDRDALMSLPGIGRKSANVILSNAFGEPAFAVDTHVGRLARRLGLSKEQDPTKVERDLTARIDRDRWSRGHHLLIWHGRRCCFARKPECGRCVVAELCPSAR
jgi:endonuclease III